MPLTFLVVVFFGLSAVASPLVLVALACALRRPAWRAEGKQAGRAGLAAAAVCLCGYLTLAVTLGRGDGSFFGAAFGSAAGFAIGTVGQVLWTTGHRWYAR